MDFTSGHLEGQNQLLAITMEQHWPVVVMAVQGIANNRMTTVGEVDPNLVGAAGFQA